MCPTYNNRQFENQDKKNEYLRSCKPVKAWEDLGQSFEALPKAESPDAFCKVTILYASELYSRAEWFVGDKKGLLKMPDLCALIERYYPDGKVRRVLFDAATRKDSKFSNELIQKMASYFRIASPFGAGELIEEMGISLEDIEGVYLSHMHFDHSGDISIFPKSTTLGIGAVAPKSPQELSAALDLPESAFEGRNIEILEPTGKQAGPFPVCKDVFGDGSCLMLNTQGHTPHHMSCAVRISAEGEGKWMLWGGDTCHHASMLFADPKTGLTSPDSLGAIYSPEFGPNCCAPNHQDLESAYKVMSGTARMEKESNVLVMLAHDGTIPPLMEGKLIMPFDPTKHFTPFKQRNIAYIWE